jgi:MoxR-like ATPase
MDVPVSSGSELSRRLAAVGYLADDALGTTAYLALAMRRPLLLEGEPGTGKTALAEALAEALGLPLIRLQCYEGLDASQSLYDWNFPAQILHLRAAETRDAGTLDQIEGSLYAERFLVERPILKALRQSPAVLLIDEIDRADDEFEAFLLEFLSTFQISIPELGVVRGLTPPVVVLTSNRTRELHDALKRRCLYHWIDHPGPVREVEILRSRLPEVPQKLADQVIQAVQLIRSSDSVLKPPGIAETLDWVRALLHLGCEELDVASAAVSLGAVCKYREDAQEVERILSNLLV